MSRDVDDVDDPADLSGILNDVSAVRTRIRKALDSLKVEQATKQARLDHLTRSCSTLRAVISRLERPEESEVEADVQPSADPTTTHTDVSPPVAVTTANVTAANTTTSTSSTPTDSVPVNHAITLITEFRKLGHSYDSFIRNPKLFRGRWGKYVDTSFSEYRHSTTIVDIPVTVTVPKQGRPSKCRICDHSILSHNSVFALGESLTVHVKCFVTLLRCKV